MTTAPDEPTLTQLLNELVAKKARSLVLTAGTPPVLRIGDALVRVGAAPLNVDRLKKLILPVLPNADPLDVPKDGFASISFGLRGLGRFTLTAYQQRGAPAAVFKVVPFEAPVAPSWIEPSFAWLQPSQFVVVAGPTGSGKSSAMASLVEHVNRTRQWHVITLEEPIAYTFPNRESVIEQIDLETGMRTYDAVRVARESGCDAVMVGRDDELETALSVFGAGALVLATLTISTPEAAIELLKKHLLPSQWKQLPGIVWLDRPGEGRLVDFK